jgi:hypothetical protein
VDFSTLTSRGQQGLEWAENFLAVNDSHPPGLTGRQKRFDAFAFLRLAQPGIGKTALLFELIQRPDVLKSTP